MRQVLDIETGEVTTYNETSYIVTRNSLVNDLITVQADLKRLRERERYIRIQLAQLCYNYHPNKDQNLTQYEHLGNGYRLKAEFKTYRRFNSKDDAHRCLSLLIQHDKYGAHVGELVVTWSPSVDMPEYFKLPNSYKNIIDETTKRHVSLPKIEFLEPKCT